MTNERWAEEQQRRQQHVAEAAAKLDELMQNANLPEESRIRLRKAFRNATTKTGMKEAVNVELRHVAQMEAECC